MDKKLFSELLDSVRDAGRIRRGQKAARAHAYAPETVLGMRKSFKPSQIIRVRHRLKMSQAEFARRSAAAQQQQQAPQPSIPQPSTMGGILDRLFGGKDSDTEGSAAKDGEATPKPKAAERLLRRGLESLFGR